MALQPTFSPTPPALYDDDDNNLAPWAPSATAEATSKQVTGWQMRSHPSDPNVAWEDSSDEDEEYSRARRLLHKLSGK